MSEDKKVLFDPGYAPLVINSLGQVGYLYYTFSAVKDLKAKRLNFPMTFRRIEKHLNNTIYFYLGCLLWATYLKKFDDFEIVGNQLLGEDCEEYEYTRELDFLIDYTKNQIPKDFKYYLNKTYEIDERFIKILETYREFLVINKGFCNVSKTNQIELPKNLKKPSELEILNEKIKKAIQERNLEQLLELYDLIF